MILFIFFDETKNTIELLIFDKFSKSLSNNFFFREKNRRKNLSENPLIETAAITDEGPGIGLTVISLAIHSFTKIAPGSDTLGVPASEIREIIEPFFNKSIIFKIFFFH